jgi:hypothetical protein
MQPKLAKDLSEAASWTNNYKSSRFCDPSVSYEIVDAHKRSDERWSIWIDRGTNSRHRVSKMRIATRAHLDHLEAKVPTDHSCPDWYGNFDRASWSWDGSRMDVWNSFKMHDVWAVWTDIPQCSMHAKLTRSQVPCRPTWGSKYATMRKELELGAAP